MTSIMFTGDNNGHDLVYIDCRNLNEFKTLSRNDLASEVTSGRVTYSSKSLTLYLRFGFFPPPYTPYHRIYVLTCGDKLLRNLNGDIKYITDFKYLEPLNSNNSDPNSFDEYFTNCATENLPKNEPLSLLLSGGKDSTSLLLALKETGYSNIECLTYQTQYQLDEAPYARDLADYLGYKHIIVEENPLHELTGLICAAESGQPFVADLALPAYCAILRTIKTPDSIIIDGMGNDIYCGHMPPKRETVLRRLSIPAHGLPLLWAHAPLFNLDERADYFLQSIFMYPVERFFSGSRLEYKEIGNINHANFVREYVKILNHQINGLDEMSARAFIRGRLFDCCGGMEKARIAAGSRALTVRFPFASKQLADYWFNLPSEYKYDYSNRINKLILRKYINSRKGPVKTLTAKGSFRFDINNFLLVADNDFKKAVSDTNHMIPFPGLTDLYCNLRRYPNNYVASCRAFLIGILGVWMQRSGLNVTLDVNEQDPFTNEISPF